MKNILYFFIIFFSELCAQSHSSAHDCAHDSDECAPDTVFVVYPNPAVESFQLSPPIEEVGRLYDVRGRFIASVPLHKPFQTENFGAGIYFLRFRNEVKKVVLVN